MTLDKDLRERHGGCWEGLTDTEIRARYPAEHATWNPPDGEPSVVVADRVAGALQRIAAAVAEQADRPADGLAVVVSHGAALRLGMSRLLGMPDELFGVLGPLSNCSWSVLGRRRDRWRLLEHNAGTLPEPILSDDRRPDHYPERAGRFASVTWYGQAGFRLAAGDSRVLIDPFLTDRADRRYRPPAAAPDFADVTLVLCTHEHVDHLDLPFLRDFCAVNPTAPIVVPVAGGRDRGRRRDRPRRG